MIRENDDPHGAAVRCEAGPARPLHGWGDAARSVVATRDGGVYTYDARSERAVSLRVPSLPPRGSALQLQLPLAAGGVRGISVERATALAWFHSDASWARARLVTDPGTGQVLGFETGPRPAPSPAVRRGAHLRTLVTKFNSLSWYFGGVLEVNGRVVRGAQCMGELFCWLPHEGSHALAMLSLRARGHIPRDPVVGAPSAGERALAAGFRDGDALNLADANVYLSTRPVPAPPPRLRRVREAAASGASFAETAVRLSVKRSTLLSYTYQLLVYHILNDQCAAEARRVMLWALGPSALAAGGAAADAAAAEAAAGAAADRPDYGVQRLLSLWRASLR